MAPNVITHRKVCHEIACQLGACSLRSSGRALGQDSYRASYETTMVSIYLF